MAESGQGSESGEVSGVTSLDPAAADVPISDDQAVAGYPDSESGQPDEGPTGPNANTNKGVDRQHRDPQEDQANG
jgi:hypothetical protein